MATTVKTNASPACATLQQIGNHVFEPEQSVELDLAEDDIALLSHYVGDGKPLASVGSFARKSAPAASASVAPPAKQADKPKGSGSKHE